MIYSNMHLQLLPVSLILQLFFVTLIIKASSASGDLDLKKTQVWGPGLKSDIVLPARYFFIQPFTKDGIKITEDLGENPFKITIKDSSNNGNGVRVRQVQYRRRDGLIIVTYRLYSSFEDGSISITYNSKHVAESPYKLKGSVYHEKCDCPQPDLAQWYKDMGCPESYRQIDSDLSIFPEIDIKTNIENIISRYNSRGMHSLSHYKIINNKIYRKTQGQHVGFKKFSDSILQSLARKVHLPDTELVVNLGDWPLDKKASYPDPVALFSWCGSEDTRDIVMPTYDLTEATLEMLGRQSLSIFSVMGNSPTAWENKTEVGFFRGRDSRQERLDLVIMSRKYPELIDAKLTRMFFFPHDEEKLGELVKHISFYDFFNNKYQLNVDGTVAAYRFPYLLSGDSVVLKQDSPYYEHFYKDIHPYQHYVPYARDLSDLRDQIRYAKENDEQMREISQKAQDFTLNNIDPVNIFCYHVKLIEKYTSLFKSPVAPPVGDEWELVDQPNGNDAICKCKFPTKQTHEGPQNKDKKDEL